jgi:hypothetical protein
VSLNKPIQSFHPDGSFERFRSLDSALYLESTGKAVLKRNRKKHVVAVFLSQENAGHPLRRDGLCNTKYSYRERLPDGHSCHDLKRLNGARQGLSYAPPEVRPIFLAVLTSCLVSA